MPTPVPPGVVTETLRAPAAAPRVIVMFTLICVSLFTVKLLTVMPSPKLTAVAPVKLAPFIMILFNVCPWLPELGLTEVTAVGLWKA